MTARVERLGGDPDHRAGSLDGAGLEAHMCDAGVVEFLDQFDGLFEIGQTGADHEAVERRPDRSGLLHQPLSADLQLPQVRIEEQRIELNRPARLEQIGQFGDPVLEDLLGDLAAAGQFGPVPGIGRRRDDLGVDGGRRHTGQQDRRTSGQPGELGGQLDRTVGERTTCGAKA